VTAARDTSKAYPTNLVLVMCALLACSCDDLRARQNMRAIQNIRIVQEAEASYYISAGHYADLRTLTDEKVHLLSGDFNDVVGGYRFKVTNDGRGYRLTAWESAIHAGNFYSLYSDESNVIRLGVGPAPATSKSPRIDGDGTLK
jgi:hypothetical protein